MRIGAVEQELLDQEIGVLLPGPGRPGLLREARAQDRYTALREHVREGDVPDELLGHLGNLLELGLQSGRLRALYGADGEQALTRVFHRTPAGAGLSEAARGVTEALEGLRGQRVEDIHVSALGPGTYGVSIDTDRCQVSLRLDRTGVRVESLALGI